MPEMLDELFKILEPDKSEENRGTIIIKGDLYANLNVDANVVIMGDIKSKINATGEVKRFGGLEPLTGTVTSTKENEDFYDIVVRNGTLTIGNSLYKANYNHFYTNGSIVNEANTVTKINCDIEAIGGYGDTSTIINNGSMFYIAGQHTVAAISAQSGCGVTNYDGWFYIGRGSTLRTSGHYAGFKNTGHGSLGIFGKMFAYGGDIGLHNTSLVSVVYPGKLYVNSQNIGIYNYNTGSIATSGLESIVSSSSEEGLYNLGGNVTVTVGSSIVAFGGVFNSHLPNVDETTKKFIGIHVNGGAIYAYSVWETDAVHNRGLIDGPGEIYSNGNIYYRELKYQTIPRFEDIEDETDFMLDKDISTTISSDDNDSTCENEEADTVTDEELGREPEEESDMSIDLPEGVDPSDIRVNVCGKEYVIDPDSYTDKDEEPEVDEKKEEPKREPSLPQSTFASYTKIYEEFKDSGYIK